MLIRFFTSFLRWIKSHQTEVFIFLLAFGVRFLYAIFVQIIFGSHGFIAHSDAFSFYLRGAENVVNHHIFSMNTASPYMPDAYRTPIYTFFVALFLWLRSPLFGIIAVQNILAGVVSVLAYRIGVILFSSRNISLFAAILVGIEPISIYWNNLLMSDYLFAFLFIFACHEFFLRRYYSFGILLGLATLTRPIGLYFFPLFLLMAIIVQLRQNKASVKKMPWRKFVIMALLFFLVLFPWMLRNKIVFNTWQLSSASWYNLYGVLAQRFADKEGFILPRPALPPEYPNPELFHYDLVNVPFYKQQFFAVIKERPLAYAQFHSSIALKSLFVNPYNYLADYVLKPEFPALFYGMSGTLISLAVTVGGIVWIVIYVLMLFSFFDKQCRIWPMFFLAIIALNSLMLGSLGVFGPCVSRYTMPLVPFMFLFAGAGLRLLFNKAHAIISSY